MRPGNLRAVLDTLDIDPDAAGATYPEDVVLLQAMVGQWMRALPEGQRKRAQDELVAFILAHR